MFNSLVKNVLKRTNGEKNHERKFMKSLKEASGPKEKLKVYGKELAYQFKKKTGKDSRIKT